MSSTGMGGHQTTVSARTEWLTPPHILEALGAFDLDPCAAVNQPWRTAMRQYTIEDDGLSHSWPKASRVWLNPPYGKPTREWLSRLRLQGNGIALIFARTETEMFFSEVWEGADSALFIRGRLEFCGIDGVPVHGSGAPSVLVAYGSSQGRVLEYCGIPGKFIEL
jgi:phage N-6-adenine-methyltransferase